MADIFLGPGAPNSSSGSRDPFRLSLDKTRDGEPVEPQTENSSSKYPVGISSPPSRGPEVLGFGSKNPRNIRMPILGIRSGDIAFAVAIGFLAGILAASFGWPILIIAAAFILGGLFALVTIHKKMLLYGALFSSAAVFCGAYYFYFFTNMRSAAVRLPSAVDDSFRAIVFEEPIASENYLSFSAELQPPFSGTVSVFASPASDIRYGDLLNILGTIEPSRNAGELPAVFPKQVSVVSRGDGFWLTKKLLDFKSTINRKFGEFLPQDEAALQGGMTLGGTTGMSAALKNEMAASETLYATSMYGYKIAMIVMMVEVIFSGFIPRRIRFCFGAVLAFLFMLMSGGNISAMRGGVMACFVMLAKETGSVFSKRNALALTAAGMAVFDPTVARQAGFLFSFASVAGMAFLAGPIQRFLRLGEGKGIFRWKEAVVLSVSSLVPIIPLISAIFGSFSLTAIFANILIAPTIPLGMTMGAVLAVTGFISQYAAFFVARAASAVLDYALWVVHFFAVHAVPMPFSFSGAVPFVLYYAAVGLFAYAYRENKKGHSERSLSRCFARDEESKKNI
jgi:ComEC/Rec2-related protein